MITADAPVADLAAFAPPSPRGLEGASILSFAVDRWTDVPRCRHHVMSRLARRNRVLFASSPCYVRDVIGARGGSSGTVEQHGETLHAYVPPRWLPYTYRFPRLDSLSRTLRTRALKKLLKRLGMGRPILYIWHPSFADVIGEFDEQLVVYHCYDEYAAFAGADRAQVEALEAKVIRAADLVLTVSQGLCDRKRQLNPNTHLIRNAVDYELFASAQDPATPIAPELRQMAGPIVGCVTRIVPEYFDAELLHSVFARRTDWSFVVVGPECAESPALSRLKALANVHFLGRRQLSELPSYLKAFDACLIPYVLTENKLLADPLKLYEYLGAGKPVVSKPLPLPAPFAGVVSFADRAGDWIDAISEAIATDSDERIARRQQLARQNTWDERVETIGRLIAGAAA